MKLARFFLTGVFFGIVLTKAEAVSWYRIYEMFQFQSFHMFGIIGTALFTGIIGIQLIKKKKLKPNDPCNCGKLDKLTNLPKKYKKCCMDK